MEQVVERVVDRGQEPARKARRPAAQRVAKPAAPKFSRPEARRKAAAVATTTESEEERLKTLGLRGSIVAAMLGMSAFFHAPLGAALASLFN